MNPKFYLVVMVLLLLMGCATNGGQSGNGNAPRIERISPEALEKLMPKPVPNLSMDEIVRLSQQGVAPDAIIQKIQQSQSRYTLMPSQIIALSKQGVDAKVLDYIYSVQQAALRDGFADEIDRREQACQDKINVLEQQLLIWSYPYYGPYWGPYWGPYPYGYYRYQPRGY